MNDKIEQLKSILATELQENHTLDIVVNSKGVHCIWCKLDLAFDIKAVANAVKTLGGRLSTITAYQLKTNQPSMNHEIAYHFDISGATLTATIQLLDEKSEIVSLTPIFRNADWNEREFMELYDINVIDHPNPKRLFIDETIDAAVLQRYIPYSAMVNAASTKTLWENIMSNRGEN